MALYSVDKLMTETRRLAVEFKKTTGQALPVSGELAIYDAMRLLALTKPELPLAGVDALGQANWLGRRFQIKSRVLFEEQSSKPRVGQLNLDGQWDWVLLVLFDAEYQPLAIYSMDRPQLEALFQDSTKNRRGALTVARFRAVGQKVWARPSADAIDERLSE